MRDEIKLILPTSWMPNREEFLAALGCNGQVFSERI